ncbi:hypothetical protein F4778DRAFT_771239 [Xylariomycetidae sp. FL2044]|nr:hypothetical protein F4778DRAFT_771239 [Xylariomycetidae sp. FL2044]
MSLEGFVKLGPNILLYTPPEYRPGHLVILCTWLGAADKHIVKYVDIHLKNRPNAKVLLVKSVVGSMISSFPRQERDMEPAQKAICEVLNECGGSGSQDKPQIMIHLMSNGGANSVTNLLVLLERNLKRPLPVVGLVCDSTPSASSYTKTCNAFMPSFPYGFPLNVIALAFVHVTITLLYLSIAMGRYPPPENYWRESILDPKLIDTNRVAYIASKADKITNWEDVVAHAGAARQKGWETRELLVDDTTHVNHFSKHKDAYLDAVAAIWDRGGL